MSDLYFCENQARRLKLQRARGASALNGVDFLEVIDNPSLVALPRQQILIVHVFQPLTSAQLRPANIAIRGGTTVAVGVVWAYRATELLQASTLSDVSASELAALKTFLAPFSAPSSPPTSPPSAQSDLLLLVRTDRTGDFSAYELSLAASNSSAPPPQFDPQLRSVRFFFKTNCPSDLDCLPPPCLPSSDLPTAPELDYQTKDYAGFRQLMLDRLAVLSPDLVTQSAADLPVVLVELLARAADKLSYFQDAVATEAYLGTARRRRSVRRHARLLDYSINEGSNARVFVQFAVSASTTIPRGTALLASRVEAGVRITQDLAAKAVATGAPIFETMHALDAAPALGEIRFYTWGDDRCCLPAGATRATLTNTGGVLLDGTGALLPGIRGSENGGSALLLFVEQLGPGSGLAEDADPHHRHVVRLTRATISEDPLYTEAGSPPRPQRVVEIEWSLEDALPFPLCLWQVLPQGGTQAVPVSVARGNVALADHGRTVSDELLPPVVDQQLFRPTLQQGPLTWQGRVQNAAGQNVPFDDHASASAALTWEPGSVAPAISLVDAQLRAWAPQRDLLESDPLAQSFVVETEDDGSIELRFGDGTLGRQAAGTFKASYRVGNGIDGNIGANAIAHLVLAATGPALPVIAATNPLPAVGGAPPESIEHVRVNAAQAFRVQKRAVTAADYAAAAELHPDVQRAHTVRRFMGGWHTMFIAIDRFGGRPVDEAFQAELLALLEPFRLTGHDIVIQEARSVPLEIVLTVCVKSGFIRADVRRRLADAFGAIDLPDGTRGFFHPDNFTFGQPLYLSRVLAAVMAVIGVASIDTSGTSRFIFRRTDRSVTSPLPSDPNFDLDFGVIRVAASEIIRLDSDINRPQNGKITFILLGGK